MTSVLKNFAKKELALLSTTGASLRDYYLKIIEEGRLGEKFIEALAIAENEKEEPLVLSDFFLEYANFLAEMRISTKVISGCAQSGKSMFAILFYTWFASKCGFNSFFVFPTVTVKDKLVGTNHKPLINNFERVYSKGKRSSPVNNLSIHKCHNNAVIRWIGVTKTGSGSAAASKNVVSFSADILLVDEISQYQREEIDKLDSRLNASRVPYKTRYYIGTKGSGSGAEFWIKQCRHQFYPGVYCPHCGQLTFLHVFGGLLKKGEVTLSSGDVVQSYLNESQRPIRWTHKDSDDPINTAFISCQHCDGELTDDVIKGYPDEKGVFRGGALPYDTVTGKSIKELLRAKKLPPNASIELSPLMFGNGHIKSIKLLEKGLYGSCPDDWLQQTCGIASDYSSTVITEEQLREAQNLPVPEFKDYTKQIYPKGSWERVTVAGIDAGRASDYLVVMNVYYQHAISKRQTIDEAIREIVYIKAVPRSNIVSILETFSVTYGLADGYPSVQAMATLADQSNGVLDLAAQKPKQLSDFKVSTIRDGGQEYKCVFISHWKRIREIITRFSNVCEDGYPRYRFTHCGYIFDGVGDDRPYKHLTAMSFDQASGKPNRPDNHEDDEFYALMFAESAFQYYIDQDQSVGGNINDWLLGFS